MNKTHLYTAMLYIAALSLLAALVVMVAKDLAVAGPFLIVFFIALAIGIRRNSFLRGYSYTIIIFAAVVTALYYPSYFVEIGDFRFAMLITPLIQLIMFGMGTSMGIKDFVGVAKTPRGVVIGVASHFIIMPLVGFSLASVSNFSPEIAAGIILIGSSPGGMASNVITYLAKGNLALSITLTAVSTMIAPLVTPLLMKLLAGAYI